MTLLGPESIQRSWDALRSCSECGGWPSVKPSQKEDEWFVQCFPCGYRVGLGYGSSREDAIDEWQRIGGAS